LGGQSGLSQAAWEECFSRIIFRASYLISILTGMILPCETEHLIAGKLRPVGGDLHVHFLNGGVRA
jgi:hypothetical protein